MDAISPELKAILDDYVRRGGLCELPRKGRSTGALLARDGGLKATIASVPEARTAMLYASAGQMRRADEFTGIAGQDDWKVLDGTPNARDVPRGRVLYRPQSCIVAFTSSARVEELDGPRFDRWIESFFDDFGRVADAVSGFVN